MSNKKKKQREKRRESREENNNKKEDKKDKKEEVILMGSPSKDTKELPVRVEETLRISKKPRDESKSVRIDFGEDIEHTTASEEELKKVTVQKKDSSTQKEHISLGKIFMWLIALFVVYLVVGQIANLFGPTTISLFSLWPLLFVFIGLSLFKVKKKGITRLLAITLVVIIFIASASLIVKGGNIATIQTEGVVVTEERGVDPFSVISFDGVGTLKITEGDRESVIVSADEAVIEEVSTIIEGDTLYIKYDNLLWSLFHFGETKMNVEVISRDVSKIVVSGTVDVTVSDINGEKLDFGLNGTGEVLIEKVNLEELVVRLNGTGAITTSGVSTREFVFLNGSGSYDGLNLLSAETGVRISGTGDAEVYTEEELNVSISGTGSVVYTGEPKLTGGNINGTGSVMSQAQAKAETEVAEPEAVDNSVDKSASADSDKVEVADEAVDNREVEDAQASSEEEPVIEVQVEKEDTSAIVENPEDFLKALNSVLE